MYIPENILKEQIRRGTILHSTMFEEIDHGKFFVVIGVNEELIAGFFFVNSQIHPSIFNKQEQLNLQYPMRHSDYPFLKYDSFLCATNVIKRSIQHIAQSMGRGETTFVGTMKKEHLTEVLEMVRRSKMFSKRDKDLFFR